MVAPIIKAKNIDGMAKTPINILIFKDNMGLLLFDFIGSFFPQVISQMLSFLRYFSTNTPSYSKHGFI
jgi:hypothetical protein